MPCQTAQLPNGGRAIVCGPRRRLPACACGAPARLLCDWKMPAGGTCDAPICEICTLKPAEGKDLCKVHARSFADWLKARGHVR